MFLLQALCRFRRILPLPRTGAEGLRGLRAIIGDAFCPRLLIGDVETIDGLRNLLPAFDQNASGCSMRTVEELIATADGEHYADASSEDLAFLQYTSGSTASPRGVMISHANVLSNLRAMEKAAIQTAASRHGSKLAALVA